jgi:hypothetical protein
MTKFFVLPLSALLWAMLSPCIVEVSGNQMSAGEKNSLSPVSQSKGARPNEEYSLSALGNGRAGDGTELSVRVYKSSDGTRVTAAHGHFKSMAAAQAEWERELRQDGKILERGSRTNASGNVVGQRAIAHFSATSVLPERSAVLFTDNRDYYQISSSSMELAVDVAKRYYNY